MYMLCSGLTWGKVEKQEFEVLSWVNQVFLINEFEEDKKTISLKSISGLFNNS